MKKIVILMLLSVVMLHGQGQRWIDADGTIREYWKIGKDAGRIQWDPDSLKYMIITNTDTFYIASQQWVSQGGTSLPSMPGNSGKYLSTTGSTAFWKNVKGELSASYPIVYDSTTGAFTFNYNSTHFSLVSNQLAANNITVTSDYGVTGTTFTLGGSTKINTPQDLRTTAAPTFNGATFNGAVNLNHNLNHSGNYSIYNNFVSGWSGTGYRLDYNVGSPNQSNFEVDNITVRGTMSVYELLIRQYQAVNGNIIISSGAKIDYISGSYWYFEDPSNHDVCPFALNDIILIQNLDANLTTIKKIFRRVTAVSGKRITVTSLSGAPADSGSPESGDAVVRIGNTTDATRQSCIILASDEIYSPYIDFVTGVNSYAAWVSANKTKVRAGRLDGYTSSIFGALSGMGLVGENVYLSGTIQAIAGIIGGWNLDASYLWSGTKQTSDTYSTSGITLASAGAIRSPEFYISSSTGDAFFKGELNAPSGNIGGWYLDANYLWTGTKQTSDTYSTSGITLASAGAIRSPEFYISSSTGDAYFKGELNAPTGNIGGWTLTSIMIADATDVLRIRSDYASIYTRPQTGKVKFVMLGQTHNGTAYTGNYGISAIDNSNNFLFRLDDSELSIAGWNFDVNKFYNGSATVGFSLNKSSTPYITGTSAKGFEVYDVSNPKVFIGKKDGNSLDWNVTTANTLTIKGTMLSSKFSTHSSFSSSAYGTTIENVLVHGYLLSTHSYSYDLTPQELTFVNNVTGSSVDVIELINSSAPVIKIQSNNVPKFFGVLSSAPTTNRQPGDTYASTSDALYMWTGSQWLQFR